MELLSSCTNCGIDSNEFSNSILSGFINDKSEEHNRDDSALPSSSPPRSKLNDKTARFPLRLGHYDLSNLSTNLFWSPEFRNIVREKRLLRKCAIISDTSSIISIYSLGIDGRLFSANNNINGRMLILEAYSVWNSQRYFITLSLQYLKELFKNHVYLFKPGNKMELVKRIIKLLYFRYTITIPNMTNGSIELLIAKSNKINNMQFDLDGYDDDHIADSTLKEDNDVTNTVKDEVVPETLFVNLNMNNKDDNSQASSSSNAYWRNQFSDYIQVVEHLQLPVMPEGYPRTVEEMTRADPVLPETGSLPIVALELMIGSEPRENGPFVRKVSAAKRKKQAEREEELRRLALLALPKWKRYLSNISAINYHSIGKVIILMGYRRQLTPNTIQIYGYLPSVCDMITISIGLNNIQLVLDIENKPVSWNTDEISSYVKRSLRLISLEKAHETSYFMQFGTMVGSQTHIKSLRTVWNIIYDSIYRHYDRRWRNCRIHFNNSMSYPSSHISHNSSNSSNISKNGNPMIPSTLNAISNKIKESMHNFQSKVHAWSQLGANGSSRLVDSLMRGGCRPRRELNNAMRLSSGCITINRVHIIYTLSLKGKLVKGAIPEWKYRYENIINIDPNLPPKEEEEDATIQTNNSNPIINDSDLLAPLDKEEQSDEDEDEEETSKKEPDLIDLKNAYYTSFCPGVIITIEVYIPHHSSFSNIIIPACSTYTIELGKPELFRMIEDKDLLIDGMLALYKDFYLTATAVQVQRAELAWKKISEELMQSCYWRICKPSLLKEGKNRSNRHNNHSDVKLSPDDMNAWQTLETIDDFLYLSFYPDDLESHVKANDMLYQDQSELWLDVDVTSATSPTVAALTVDSQKIIHDNKVEDNIIDNNHNSHNNDDIILIATLSFSNIIFSKSLKINRNQIEENNLPTSQDNNESRPKLMEVTAWQCGERVGIICIDHFDSNKKVYLAQPKLDMQVSQTRNTVFLTKTEKFIVMQMYLSTDLMFVKKTKKNGATVERVIFSDAMDDGDDEDMTMNANIIMDEDNQMNDVFADD
eukprot:gene6706-9198_t